MVDEKALLMLMMDEREEDVVADDDDDDTLLKWVAPPAVADSSVATVATTDAVKLMMAVATDSNVSRRSSGSLSCRWFAATALPDTTSLMVVAACRTNGKRPVFTWGTPLCS